MLLWEFVPIREAMTQRGSTLKGKNVLLWEFVPIREAMTQRGSTLKGKNLLLWEQILSF